MPLPTICLIRPDEGRTRKAGFVWRSGHAIRHLGPILAKEGIWLTEKPMPDALAYRLQEIGWDDWDELDRLKKWGAKVIADFDDNPFYWPPLPNVPKSLQATVASIRGNVRQAELMKQWISYADICTATTEAVGKVLERDYVVLPNLIDVDDYCHPVIRPERDHVLILFFGSQSHLYDLVQMEEPCARILDKYPQARFLFWGCFMPPAMELRAKAYGERWAWKPFEHYDNFQAELMKIAPDIGLAPLDDNPFANCRSPIKWMEYTLAGCPVVASDVALYAPYCDYRCSMAEDWFKDLAFLIENPSSRKIERERSLDLVISDHCWQSESARQPWLDFFRGLMA